MSEIPEHMMQEAKYATLHPETVLTPDPNKPFKNLEGLFRQIQDLADKAAYGVNPAPGFFDDSDSLDDVLEMAMLLIEFIKYGFNRESDINKGLLRVSPFQDMGWLYLAIIIRTSMEYHNITMDRLHLVYNLRKHKGKIIDFSKVLTDQPMSRWHRKIVASAKMHKLKIKNDRVILDAARHWYQCRVVYAGPKEFSIDYLLRTGIELEPANINIKIKPVDMAIGYRRRILRKN